MDTSVMIPPGYRFNPTDRVLITEYLLKRAMGLPLPCNYVLEKNLYGADANPWDVFDINNHQEDSHWATSNALGSKNVSRVVYVFTRLMKVSSNGKNIARTAGGGKWDGQTAPKKIFNSSGEEIGMMKMLNFQAKKGVDHDRWIMHEFSLSGVLLMSNELKYEDYVVCKITRIFSKEKFDREEKEKRLLYMNMIKNVENSLPGKKRSIELLQEGQSGCKKQKTVIDPEVVLELDDNLCTSTEEISEFTNGGDDVQDLDNLSGPMEVLQENKSGCKKQKTVIDPEVVLELDDNLCTSMEEMWGLVSGGDVQDLGKLSLPMEIVQDDPSVCKKQKTVESMAAIDPEADFNFDDDLCTSIEEIRELINGGDGDVQDLDELSWPIEVLQDDQSDCKKEKTMESMAAFDPEADFKFDDNLFTSLEEMLELVNGVDVQDLDKLSWQMEVLQEDQSGCKKQKIVEPTAAIDPSFKELWWNDLQYLDSAQMDESMLMGF